MDGWPNSTKRKSIANLEILVTQLTTDIATLTSTVTTLQGLVGQVVTSLEAIQTTINTAEASNDASVVAANQALTVLITNLKTAIATPKPTG